MLIYKTQAELVWLA